MENTRNYSSATMVATFALVLWAVEPLVVSELQGFPLFQSLTLVFISCFILTAIRITIKGAWSQILSQPLFVWLFGVLGICGSDFAYVLGAYVAPISHVDLIDYLWPFMVILCFGFLPNQKLYWKHVIGGTLGFFGVALMLCSGSDGFNPDYLNGYILAIFGVMLWGAYSAYSHSRPDTPSDMVGIYCGIGAVITFVLHLMLEETVSPTLSQGGLAVLLGLAGPGLAYQLWDHGMKFGNARWLSVCCYFARMFAMALLVFFGKEQLSHQLVISCVLASVGVFISSIDEDRLLSLFKAIAKQFALSADLPANPEVPVFFSES